VVATAVVTGCRICASTRAVSAFGRLLRCLDCGLVYREGAATADYDARYYESGGYRAYFSRSTQWRREARRRLRWLLAAARPRSLLEAGCAGGYFVAAARRARIVARGVELSPVAAEHARSALGVPVAIGAFEDLHLSERFDAVCAFHVLEHVADPHRFLARAHGLLAPGGWLALEVPNVESARALGEGERWFALEPEYHLSHFGPRTLVRLVLEEGFAPERCDTVFAHHYAPPRLLLGPFGRASVRAAGSLRSVDPSRGDFLRLLARRR
jgi:SAM-dependent methyltransferase